ncbi:MAG TPA: IclR family transcriptional regulator [Gaiellales bacterium]|nr:IclR family transcriptional regulator [Gaiellales bacterium]
MGEDAATSRRRTAARPPPDGERETSIRRGVEALLALAGDEAAAEGGLGVTRVARMLGREKTQVSRTLATLAEYGLLDRDPDTRAYRLGWRIYAMAHVAGQRLLLDAARPRLVRLVDRFGEGAHLSVLQGTDAVTVLSQQSPRAVQAVTWVGRTAPAYCTSAGKALLLDRTPAELRELFRGFDFARVAPNTPTSVTRLIASIAESRSRGYTVADEEMDAGLVAAAAPVRDLHDRIVAAVNVSGPAFRMRPVLAEIGAGVVEAADEVSAVLGGR